MLSSCTGLASLTGKRSSGDGVGAPKLPRPSSRGAAKGGTGSGERSKAPSQGHLLGSSRSCHRRPFPCATERWALLLWRLLLALEVVPEEAAGG